VANSPTKAQFPNLLTAEDLGIICHYGHGRTIRRGKRPLQSHTT